MSIGREAKVVMGGSTLGQANSKLSTLAYAQGNCRNWTTHDEINYPRDTAPPSWPGCL